MHQMIKLIFISPSYEEYITYVDKNIHFETIMRNVCDHFRIDIDHVVFLYKADRLRNEDTPESKKIQRSAIIDIIYTKSKL